MPVWAAGAAPLRGRGTNREVLLVHRPAYDDWTLPKGKAHLHELLPATAVREVAEESATRIRLGAPLTPTRHPVGQTMKMVSWWVGVTLAVRSHTPNSEVDHARWLTPEAALATLTYQDERAVLAEAVALPDTTPLVIARHAKARNRETWRKEDRLRPLNDRGVNQLPFLNQILAAFGITNLVSSPSTRCVQTLQPYARSREVRITRAPVLAEETATEAEVGAYMARLARAVGASGIPTVVCGHRPVIPAMLAPLDIPPRFLATASIVIAHVDAAGHVVGTEWHDTLRVKL
jgi:8-oxo-dGTP diphosphatase